MCVAKICGLLFLKASPALQGKSIVLEKSPSGSATARAKYFVDRNVPGLGAGCVFDVAGGNTETVKHPLIYYHATSP